MNADDLIDRLVADAAPVPQGWFERRLTSAVLVGAGVALGAVAALLGIREDVAEAARGSAFWLKAAYTASLGACGLLLLGRTARPDVRGLGWLWLSAVPVAAATVFALVELTLGGRPAPLDLLLTPRWTCPPLILLVTIPLFAAMIAVVRRMAPTDLRAAGAAIGLAAGGLAATVYALHCQQASATFIATRYTLAIFAAALIGALLGPRVLRW